MADALLGASVVIEVASNAAPTVFVPISDIVTPSEKSSRTTSKFPVFGRAAPYQITGPKDATLSLNVYFNPTDPGQIIVCAADAAALGTSARNVIVKVLYDGTAGYTVPATVSVSSYDPAVEGLQPITFDFTYTGAKVSVGSGILL